MPHVVTPSHVSKTAQKLCQRRQEFATVLDASELTTEYFFQKYALVDLIEALNLSWEAVSLGGFCPVDGKVLTPSETREGSSPALFAQV